MNYEECLVVVCVMMNFVLVENMDLDTVVDVLEDEFCLEFLDHCF